MIHYIFSSEAPVKVNSLQIVHSLRVLFLVCRGPLGTEDFFERSLTGWFPNRGFGKSKRGLTNGGLSPKFSEKIGQKSFPENRKRTRRKDKSRSECTKIAHRCSLAIFTADEGIARKSTARAIFTHFLRRKNRGSLAIFFAEEIAHLGASKHRAISRGAVKIAAATAENRAILVHSGPDREAPEIETPFSNP